MKYPPCIPQLEVSSSPGKDRVGQFFGQLRGSNYLLYFSFTTSHEVGFVTGLVNPVCESAWNSGLSDLLEIQSPSA